jgi:hypothetical protein
LRLGLALETLVELAPYFCQLYAVLPASNMMEPGLLAAAAEYAT